jgi:AhpD family alkylhydroperoxidase
MSERLNYMAASPRGMQAFGGVHLYLSKSGLPLKLLNLVYLRVSQINKCAHCIALHAHDLLKDGVYLQKLILLPSWRESGDLFTTQERAALQWAETLALVADTHAPEAEFEAVRPHFSDKELADLTYAIALIGAYNRIAIGFGRGPEPAFLEAAFSIGQA